MSSANRTSYSSARRRRVRPCGSTSTRRATTESSATGRVRPPTRTATVDARSTIDRDLDLPVLGDRAAVHAVAVELHRGVPLVVERDQSAYAPFLGGETAEDLLR